MRQDDMPQPPIPPLPVRPIDYRGGISPINYAQPPAGRPGIITAIGTLSIVFACVGIIGSGLLTLSVAWFGLMSQGMRTAMNTMPGGGTVMAGGTTVGGPATQATQPATQPAMALTPAQVQTAITAVQAKITGGALSPQQLSAMTAELASPSQQLIDPNMGVPLSQQVISATVMPDASVTVWFYSGNWVDVNPAGQATAHVSPGPWAVASAIFNVSTAALSLTLLGVAMGFLLAIYLLVAGIMTLRQSPKGATLHWVYVGLKVISTACVAAGSTWLFHSAIQSIGRVTTTTAMPTMAEMLPSTLFLAGLGLLYPIVLVILLRTRSAREYYRTGISAQ